MTKDEIIKHRHKDGYFILDKAIELIPIDIYNRNEANLRVKLQMQKSNIDRQMLPMRLSIYRSLHKEIISCIIDLNWHKSFLIDVDYNYLQKFKCPYCFSESISGDDIRTINLACKSCNAILLDTTKNYMILWKEMQEIVKRSME